MLLPGIGELYISAKSRLIIALVISLIITPIAAPMLPSMPEKSLALMLIILSEVIIGLFIGSVTRILLSAMHIAGAIISMQTGLAAAMLFDPSQGTQGTVIGTFLTFMAILLIFATNTHHIFLYAIVDSYTLFSPKEAIPIGGISETMSTTLSASFLIATKLAAPQLVIALMVYLAAGVMGRLMPQMQVFFLVMPLNIGLGFLVLLATLSTMLMLFMDFFIENMNNFIL